MHHMRPMIATHPDVQGSTNDALISCAEECYACAQTCTSCADACLAEEMVAQMRQCIRLNLDCADICLAAGSLGTPLGQQRTSDHRGHAGVRHGLWAVRRGM